MDCETINLNLYVIVVDVRFFGFVGGGIEMASKIPQRNTNESKPQSFVDKLVIVVLGGLALAGGWSVLGLIVTGLSSFFHVVA
jgi:hypothetical protein